MPLLVRVFTGNNGLSGELEIGGDILLSTPVIRARFRGDIEIARFRETMKDDARNAPNNYYSLGSSVFSEDCEVIPYNVYTKRLN